MSETQEKRPAAAPGGGGPRLVAVVLPAVLAAAAAFGGARAAGAYRAPATASSPHAEEDKPPGPTLPLEPFLLTIQDQNRKVHPMKVTLAIEFDSSAKEDALKGLTPRIRDATLGYLRTLTFEEAIDPAAGDKMRGDVVNRLRAAGVQAALRVLITNLVIQ